MNVRYYSLFLLLFVYATSSVQALTVNRLNGGASVIYIDFSIPGSVLPFELVRSYNSITAVNEQSGWKGSFGWGWTSPFETTLITTPDQHVLLRDGSTGNTIFFKPTKEDPAVRKKFFQAAKKAYFERKKGRKVSAAELTKLQLPDQFEKGLMSDPNFRAQVASDYGIEVSIPAGQALVSSQYGYQTIQFKNNQWIRNKAGVTQIFDGKGRLEEQRDKNGYAFYFRYSKKQTNQVEEIHSQDRSISLKFKWAADRVVQIVDHRGKMATYEYDSAANLTKVTDSNNQVYLYYYQEKRSPHLLTKIEYPSEAKGAALPYRELGYDKSGLVTFHRDRDGSKTSFSFGRSSTDPADNFWTRAIIEKGSAKETEYDEFFLKKKADNSKYLYKQISKRDGVTTTTIYTSCCGKPAQVNRNGVVTTMKYYPNGLLKERVTPREEVRLEYDPRWNKVTKVVKNKFISNYKYDGGGNLVEANNSRNDKVKLAYDRFGRILQMVDASGRTINFKYGANGKPSIITEKGVGTIRIDYNSDGRIVKTETVPGKRERKPSQEKSQAIVRRVMQGFQNLLNIIRPAGVNYSNG